MAEQTTHQSGMGALPFAGGIFFRVWAPHADALAVTGDSQAPHLGSNTATASQTANKSFRASTLMLGK